MRRGPWFWTSGVGHGSWLSRARLCAVACSLTAVARPALAEMRFEAPAGCGTEADFRRELEALVGDVASQIEPSVLEITRQADGAFRLHLEVSGEVRELGDADCRTLLRSAVVIAAAAARAEQPEPPPPPDSTPPPPPAAADPAAAAPPAIAEPPPVPARPRAPEAAAARGSEPPRVPPSIAPVLPPAMDATGARPAAFTLGGGIGISGGTLPGASAVLELRAGLDPQPVGIALFGRYWPGSEAEREGRSVHVTGLGGRAAVALELGPALQTSLGLEVDRLRGSGQEGVSGRSSDAVWLIAGALELTAIPWSVEGLRLELGLAGQLAVVRPRFVVDGFGTVYEVPRVGGGAIIRAVWLFR